MDDETRERLRRESGGPDDPVPAPPSADEEPQVDSDPLPAEEDDDVQLGTNIASILDRANEERDERLKRETIKFDIPTWDGALVAEYKLLPRQLVEAMQRRARGKRDTQSEMDMIARSCVNIYARDPDTEKLVALDEVPLRYTRDLLAKLGKANLLDGKEPEKEPYIVIRHMFAGNDIAIGAHSFRLITWMSDPSAFSTDDPGDDLGEA